MLIYSDYRIIDELVYKPQHNSFLTKLIMGLATKINSFSNNFNVKIIPSLEGYMMTHEGLINLSFLLRQIIYFKIPGEIIEVGCHAGTSAILLNSVMRRLKTAKKLILYDAFKGLQHFSSEDALLSLKPGDLKTDLSTLRNNFHKFGFKLPKVIVGNVEKTIPKKLPNKIAFAHLDLDLYSPTFHALKWVIPRLSKGSVLVLDDYGHPRISGIKKAVEDIFKQLKIEKPIHILYGGVHPPLSIWPTFRGERVIKKYQAYIQM